ncbi:MAG TPA: arsenite methyltransferase [Aggregatilineales bacterium]|nr:arsenite methyltransferase [Aggregatilineales bacterium]
MTDNINTRIHESVQAHYGAIARNNSSCCGDSSSCCGDDLSCNATLYDAAMLADLPVDVTGISLGCGDPVTIASLKPGEHVLDLGSGGGIDCFLAAKEVGATGHVIGVDMTPEMLEKAYRNREKVGVENVEFRRGHIEDLPVDDNSIDVIMSNCVINLSPDKASVFSEAFRVLKPGGRLSISDIVTEGDFSETLRGDLTKWSACVTGAIDANQYTELIKAAGFTNVTVVDKTAADEISTQQEGWYASLLPVAAEPGLPAVAVRVFSARITAYKPG